MEIYWNGKLVPTFAAARRLLAGCAAANGDDIDEYLAFFAQAITGDEYAIDYVFMITGCSMEIMTESN